MKKRLLRDIKLKSGIFIAKGTMREIKFDILHPETGMPLAGFLRAYAPNGDRFNTGLKSGGWRNNFGIKEPTMNQLWKWQEEGICKSVAGKKIEPDGWDSDGTPSWLLAMGMI